MFQKKNHITGWWHHQDRKPIGSYFMPVAWAKACDASLHASRRRRGLGV